MRCQEAYQHIFLITKPFLTNKYLGMRLKSFINQVHTSVHAWFIKLLLCGSQYVFVHYPEAINK